MATPAAPNDPSTSATPAFQSNPAGFLRDIGTNLAQLRQPSNLAAALTTSFGSAFAIGAVTLVLMFIDRRRAPITAMFGLTVFSAVDPILMLRRNSWWLGAAMSAGTWMMLLLVLVITTQAMQPMGEGSLIFLLPMMVFGGVLALSALIRLVMYLGTPKNEQSS